MVDNIFLNNLKPVRQDFDWGHVEWLDEPEDVGSGRMLVGHVVFLPGKQQGRHLHTGDEQMLYTISGRGEHWINDKFYPLIPGTVYHIPPYTEHDIRNISEDPLEMIIVYNVGGNKVREFFEEVDYAAFMRDVEINQIVDIGRLLRIQEELSKTLGLGIVILDRYGRPIGSETGGKNFCRRIGIHEADCEIKQDDTAEREGPVIKECCYDLVRIESPILYKNEHLGKIICGPVILNEASQEVIDELKALELESGQGGLVDDYLGFKKITKGRLYAIMNSLEAISSYIVDAGVKEALGNVFREKTLSVLDETRKRAELEKIVADTKMRLIESQISPHFLFNTLSVIGQLAYMDGAKEAAETTFALSKLLRKSLTKSRDLASVGEELEYIKDYIFIQNKRFDNLIELKLHADQSVMKEKIPFMTLQILVENAIKHGFSDHRRKASLMIDARREKDGLVLRVSDNGTGVDESTLGAIRSGIESGHGAGGIGYESILTRLNYYYSGRYRLSVERGPGGVGLVVTLVLKREEGSRA